MAVFWLVSMKRFSMASASGEYSIISRATSRPTSSRRFTKGMEAFVLKHSENSKVSFLSFFNTAIPRRSYPGSIAIILIKIVYHHCYNITTQPKKPHNYFLYQIIVRFFGLGSKRKLITLHLCTPPVHRRGRRVLQGGMIKLPRLRLKEGRLFAVR